MEVKYVTHSGEDLLVVNSARVSFDKQSEYDYEEQNLTDKEKELGYTKFSPVLSEKDRKLIKYLAKHNHWSPFAHPQITLHWKVPIFLSRQLDKHQVGLVKNEVSRRYVDSTPEFYQPDFWRKKAENKKQGSSDETVNLQKSTTFALEQYHSQTLRLYNILIKNGVCPEQARMILPQGMYTEYYWTGSLAAWARVYKQRSHEDSQKEHTVLMEQLSAIMKDLFPVSWPTLIEE